MRIMKNNIEDKIMEKIQGIVIDWEFGKDSKVSISKVMKVLNSKFAFQSKTEEKKI